MLKFARPLTVLVCASTLASAAVLNVEFKFTPFIGDTKTDQVETVPGKARVFMNNVPIAEQDVRKDKVPVMFAEREIAPSVWVPTASLGPCVRKGKNTIRIEFEPTDPKLAYHAQLRWATVNDGETQKGSTVTNQSGEGVDDKPSKGKVVFEKEFTADFAKDLAWHHYPDVAALTDQDKQQLAALAKTRTDAFRPPDFALVYQYLEGKEGLKVEEIRKLQCVQKAYAAGLRVPAPAAPEQLAFATTGHQEVVVTRKAGAPLYGAFDRNAFDRIKGDEMQMCAALVMSAAYPEHLVAARNSAGVWEVVY